MNRSILAVGMLIVLGLAGCGRNGSAPETGPSPYPGRAKLWFDAHTRERAAEVKWCNDNNGYVNPLQPPQRADQAAAWDPSCDAASDSWNAAMRSAKTGPGAF